MPTRPPSRKTIAIPRWQKDLINRRRREFERDPGGYFTLTQFRKLMAMQIQEFKRQQRARREIDKLAERMVRANRRAYARAHRSKK